MARTLGVAALVVALLFSRGVLCIALGQGRRVGPAKHERPRRGSRVQVQNGVDLRASGLAAGIEEERMDLEASAGAQDCTRSFLHSTCPDVNALLKFKAINADPFSKLATWTIPCTIASGSPSSCAAVSRYVCSSWQGVNCTALGRVRELVVTSDVTIDVDSAVLYGNFSAGQSIPPEFGTLEELEHLDLSRNYNSISLLGGLVGPLPLELSLLDKLTHMDLSYNHLWGQVPGWLTALSRLTHLNLKQNNFTGPLPPELGQMVDVVHLDVSFNPGLSGGIPPELGNLRSLQHLSLGSTTVSGSIPDALSKLISMQSLDIHFARLSGALPTWWASWGNLSDINLSRNELSGSLPTALGQMSRLGNLILAYNQISGIIPEGLVGGLCSKDHVSFLLDLSNNLLEGPIPPALSRCSGLSWLQLNNNQLNGTFPRATFFAMFQSLSRLDLSNNQLTGTVPSDLMQLSSLTSLYTVLLQGNKFSGPMPSIFCNSSVLLVNLSSNSFTGELSNVLSSFGACDYPGSSRYSIALDVSNNQLSGSIPSFLLSLAPLSKLHVDNNRLWGNLSLPLGANCSDRLVFFSAARNQLTGTLPAGLGTCTALKSLDLSENQLEGPIPEQILDLGNSLQTLNLQGNQLVGGLPTNLGLLQQLFTLNLSSNKLSLPLPPGLSRLRNLQHLDLSNNQLAGELPTDMDKLSMARTIEIQNNLLSGSIPVSLAPPNLPVLSLLDLSNNHLSGSIPPGFANSSAPSVTIKFASNNLSGTLPGGSTSPFSSTQPASSVANNSLLCGGLGYPSCPVSWTAISTGTITGVCIGCVVALLLILGVSARLLRRRSQWAGGRMMVFEQLDFPLTIGHILEATESFSDKYKLGRGGFGSVYRATLQDGRTVAVKRLAAESRQGEREFQTEMQTLGSIRHRNLVVLMAAYISPPAAGERLLIYNFLAGGSLDTIVRKSGATPLRTPCPWELRHSIALDVAKGLKYLHHDCKPPIIHRDLKPANVLMDDELVAQVADFGLAKLVDSTRSHVSTEVFGTIGYLAPEYIHRGRLSFKSDVFAYGVLLLQLITGKQPTDVDVAERGLSRWVATNDASAVIDSDLEVGPDKAEILGALKLGLLCTCKVPADRPTMAEVVHLLQHLGELA